MPVALTVLVKVEWCNGTVEGKLSHRVKGSSG